MRQWVTPKIVVDRVASLAGYAVASGWSRIGDSVRLDAGSSSLPIVATYSRPDVAVAHPRFAAAIRGWLALGPLDGDQPILLRSGRRVRTLTPSHEVTDVLAEQVDRLGLVLDLVNWDPAWVCIALETDLPRHAGESRARLEWAGGDEVEAVLAGWAVGAADVRIAKASTGRNVGLSEAHWYPRPDVVSAVADAPPRAGWLMRVPWAHDASDIKLLLVEEARVSLIDSVSHEQLPALPVAAARQLFGLLTPMEEMGTRLEEVDGPLLQRILKRHSEAMADDPVTQYEFGARPESPRASVVVPLYGRADFLQHLMIRLLQDDDFLGHSELILVNDDPQAYDELLKECELLWSLFGVPFTLIASVRNRGYSGANNLGARRSQGQVLIFLNSDAFPEAPGWTQRLAAHLSKRADIGALGAVLLNTDYTLQHVGMRHEFSAHWGTWLNEQPRAGIALRDAQLSDSLIAVPSVTGACMAVRAADFWAVEGFTEQSLIGDFEDSDLCFKLHERGLSAAVAPDVRAIHLHRQSLTLTGEDHFRQRVVLFNAWWHAKRWGSLMEQTVGEQRLHVG